MPTISKLLPHHIYIVSAPNGFVKIGRCQEPFRRIIGLQNGSPLILTMEYVCRCDAAEVAEREIHQRLKSFRRHGEWFEIAVPKAIKAAQSVIWSNGYLLQKVGDREHCSVRHKSGLTEIAIPCL